jgi:hypothetical protein
MWIEDIKMFQWCMNEIKESHILRGCIGDDLCSYTCVAHWKYFLKKLSFYSTCVDDPFDTHTNSSNTEESPNQFSTSSQTEIFLIMQIWI